MQDFSVRLKKLRKASGLNQDELAKKLGVRKTTISNYETGYSNPNNSILRRISEFFDVPISELLGETTVFREDTLAADAMKQVPVYASLSSTGLTGSLPVYHCEFPTAMLGEGDFFALKLTDDRMNRALLSAGSLAIIRRQSYADDGDIALVLLDDGMSVLGRFYRNGEGFVLSPESDKAVYRPFVISNSEENVTVLGKVITSVMPVL